jgi:hypothetical protein
MLLPPPTDRSGPQVMTKLCPTAGSTVREEMSDDG